MTDTDTDTGVSVRVLGLCVWETRIWVGCEDARYKEKRAYILVTFVEGVRYISCLKLSLNRFSP
jgi:hypothetical protein